MMKITILITQCCIKNYPKIWLKQQNPLFYKNKITIPEVTQLGSSSTELYMRLQLRHLLGLESSESLMGLEYLLPRSVARLHGCWQEVSVPHYMGLSKGLLTIRPNMAFSPKKMIRERKWVMERGAKTQAWKWHIVTSAMFCWLRESTLVNVGEDYIRT